MTDEKELETGGEPPNEASPTEIDEMEAAMWLLGDLG